MICPICGRNVKDVHYLSGLRKCIDCLCLIKQVRKQGKPAFCLNLFYNRF